MGPVRFVVFYLLGGLAATARADRSSARTSTVPNLGASGAIAGGARRLPRCCSRGRACVTVDLHHLLLHDPRAAGAAVPRLLVRPAAAVRLLRPARARPAAAAASPTSRTSAASCSGCSRSSCSRTSASGGGSWSRALRPEPMRTVVTAVALVFIAAARLPDAVRAVHERPRRARPCSRCSSSRCSSSGSSARSASRRRDALMPYTLFQGGRRRRRRRWPRGVALLACSLRRRLRRRADARATQPRRRAPAARRAPDAARRRRRRRRWPAAARRPRRSRCGSTTRATRCALRFKHPPRSGLLFDLDTGRVLWRRDPDARAADRVADEDDDRAAWSPTACRAARKVHDHQGGAAPTRARASGCCRAASGSASRRCSTGCCCRPATTPRSRSPSAPRGTVAALRRADERARAARWASPARTSRSPDGFVDRGNHSCARRPRGARPRGAARAAAGADRAPPPGRAAVPDQGRQALPLQQQPAAAHGLPRHDGRQDRLHRRRRAAASWRPRGAGRCGSASCCCTRPTPATQARKLLDRGFRLGSLAGRQQSRWRAARPSPAVYRRRRLVGARRAARARGRRRGRCSRGGGGGDAGARRAEPRSRRAPPARRSCRAAGARLLPDYRVVAYYGAPQDGELGALGIGTPGARGAAARAPGEAVRAPGAPGAARAGADRGDRRRRRPGEGGATARASPTR